jgi:hypothetical protein
MILNEYRQTDIFNTYYHIKIIFIPVFKEIKFFKRYKNESLLL